jgi:hypothetical protein|tara:strand:- start:1553 stop:1834 length:282 start_codon:yes stop_codon:yes gene_type:complete
MFTPDNFVDAVQAAKKTWVKTFITNDHIAESMNHFVDSQADYTKKAFKATSDAAKEIATETVKAVKEGSKFDYSKFGEGIMKAYTAQNTAKTK